jgi:hypothetical protein
LELRAGVSLWELDQSEPHRTAVRHALERIVGGESTPDVIRARAIAGGSTGDESRPARWRR